MRQPGVGLAACGVLSQPLKRDLLKSKGHRVKENQFPVTLKPQAYTKTDQLGERPHWGDGGSFSPGSSLPTPGTVVGALPSCPPGVWAGRQLVAAVPFSDASFGV